MEIKKYTYDQITQLSLKDSMYILSPEKLKTFFNWDAKLDSFEHVMKAKSSQKIDRAILTEVLLEQYQNFENNHFQLKLIEQLKDDNTYTITTAHQPSLLTGPLYYIFKIASVINLSKQLAKLHPGNNFIPCFITGGEDHDFEEINHLQIFGKRIEWEDHSWQGGSVGQIDLNGLELVLDQLNEKLGNDSFGGTWLKKEIYPLLSTAKNYSEFARMLTHSLFGDKGLLVLSMDDPKLKSKFLPAIKKEIFDQPSEAAVKKTQDSLSELSWKPQAHPRNINFFYRSQNARSRIILEENLYKTVDGRKSWTRESLEVELDENPGDFSPNVIMRPLFQETILPNLAYIGGGGEIAYWLERKSQFEHFGVPYPMLVRRNSALIVHHRFEKKLAKSSLSFENFFVQPDDLVKSYLSSLGEDAYSLKSQKTGLEELMLEAIEKAKSADPTLENFALAEVSKMQKSIDTIEKKISKAIKRKEEVELNRLGNIQSKLFPENGLQERKENIFQFINDYGIGILDTLIETLDPMDKKFTVLFMQAEDQQNQG